MDPNWKICKVHFSTGKNSLYCTPHHTPTSCQSFLQHLLPQSTHHHQNHYHHSTVTFRSIKGLSEYHRTSIHDKNVPLHYRPIVSQSLNNNKKRVHLRQNFSIILQISNIKGQNYDGKILNSRSKSHLSLPSTQTGSKSKL